MVVKTDGTKTVLCDPRSAGYSSEDGGLFWVCQHKEGTYKLVANALYEYTEVLTQPEGSGAVTVTQDGAY